MTAQPSPSYAELLHTYIARLREPAPESPTADTTQTATLLHVLTVALKHPAYWAEARDLLLQLHPYFERDGRFEEWSVLLERGIAQSEAVGDAATCAILRVYQGNVWRIQGKTDAALIGLEQALAYFADAGEIVWYGRACNGMARLLHQQGEAAAAIQWAEQALTLLPEEAPTERAVSYRILGSVAVDAQAWETAFTAFQHSLDLWRQSGDLRLIAFGLTNVGSALRGLSRYEEAAAALTEAIQSFDETGDRVNEGTARINLGNLYLMTQQYDAAIAQYYRAEQLVQPSRDVARLAGIYNNWGMAYAGLGTWERAIRAYRQSIALWATAGHRGSHANALDNLSIALYATGAYQESATACREGLRLLEGTPYDTLRDELREHLAQAENRLTPTS